MKFKNILVSSIFIVLILTLTNVSASDNSSEQDIKLIDEDMGELVDSGSNDINLEHKWQNSKLKSSSNPDTDKLKLSSDKNPIKTIDSESFNVEVPEYVEIGSYWDYLHTNISLPKNSNGKISVYKDNIHIKTFDLNANQTINRFYDNCSIYKDINDKIDLYHIEYRLSNLDIGIWNFTFKYENNPYFIEKSRIVNINYILKPAKEKINYYENSLAIITPLNLKGMVNVEIDGQKYKTYSRINKKYFINYNSCPINSNCLIPLIKSQYVKLSPKLGIGKHIIKISYSGDEVYPIRSVEYELIVNAKIKTDLFEDSKKISLELPKNARGKLVLKFYDSKKKLVKTFTQKLKNGKAVITIPKKFYGKFSKAVVQYSTNDYNVKSEIIKRVIINPPIKVPKSMLQGEKKFISINLPGKKGVLKLYVYKYHNDDFKIKKYSKRLVNGKAKISLSKFNDETEISHIQFVETLKNGKKVTYTDYSIVAIFKPLYLSYPNHHYGKARITIQAYKKGGKVVKNRYITIKINNKFVKKVKTNKWGVAEFKIPKKYKPDTYKLTVKFKKNIINKKIKINKT